MLYEPTKQDIDILAKTIYGEARGEFHRGEGGLAAFIAVANVVMNRLQRPARFGGTIQDICLRNCQFSCWNKSDPNYPIINKLSPETNELSQLAYDVAEKVATGVWPDLTQGSNHYYALSLRELPHWARGQRPQLRIGQHIFYKLDK